MARLLVSWFPLLREAGPMAPDRFTPNLPTMFRIMEKLSGQMIKPVSRDAILFLSNVIRLQLYINPCKYKLGCGKLFIVLSFVATRA